MKRIIYLLGIIAAAGATIAAGYYFRYQKMTPLSREEAGNANVNEIQPITLPPLPQETKSAVKEKLGNILGKEPTILISGGVFDYFIQSATSSIVFQKNGKVAIFTQSGIEFISDSEIQDILQAGFSSDGSKLMVLFGKRDSPQASIFDTKSKSWTPFSEEVYSFAWSPTGNKIAYLAKVGAKYEIKILDTNKINTKPQTLFIFNAEDIKLTWPKPEQIMVWQTPSAEVPGSLLKIDVTKKTIVPIIEDRNGLDITWSKISDSGLIFESNQEEKGGVLKIIDSKGKTIPGVNFITLPEKCLFYGDSEKEYLICAVPIDYDLRNIKTLPDKYLKREFFPQDWLYQIDLKTEDVKIIYGQSDNDTGRIIVDAVNLQVKDGVLYFISRLDNSLYGLAL